MACFFWLEFFVRILSYDMIPLDNLMIKILFLLKYFKYLRCV